MGLQLVGTVLVGAFAASLASFLGVVTDRVPRGETLGGRSRCVCGAPVRAIDAIPIVGYLGRRGRARCCGARIPTRYVLTEAAAAALGAGLFVLVLVVLA
jgi:leader peptidase (prepilin peptidase)/N-methyltransferase